MIRRVHSTWHTVVRSIYPEFVTHSSRELTQGGGEAWRATFFRDQENTQATIRLQSEDTKVDPWDAISNILNIIQTYPASPNILGEAMPALTNPLLEIGKRGTRVVPPWS